MQTTAGNQSIQRQARSPAALATTHPDNAQQAASSSIVQYVIDALNKPDPVAGVGDYRAAFALLDALAPNALPGVLAALEQQGHLDLLAQNLAAAGPAASRLGIAIAAVVAATRAEQPAVSSTPVAASAADQAVARMSSIEKLWHAGEFATQHLRGDVIAQLQGLLTKQSFAMMAGFAGVAVAAQATPAGWVADAFALTTLTGTAVFLGKVVFDVARDLTLFFLAINATTESDLQNAGAALSEPSPKAVLPLSWHFSGASSAARAAARAQELVVHPRRASSRPSLRKACWSAYLPQP